MFSQFRQAVENLAPIPRPPSPGDARREGVSRSGSVGPTSKNSSPTPLREGRKLTLEDRLRAATFAIGDASNATTPEISRKASPAVGSVVSTHPLSPSSTPLPDSPPAASHKAAIDIPTSIDAALADPPAGDLTSDPVNSQSDPLSEHPTVTEAPLEAASVVESDSTEVSTTIRASSDVAPGTPSEESYTDTAAHEPEIPQPTADTTANSFDPEAEFVAPVEPAPFDPPETAESTTAPEARSSVSSGTNAQATALEELQERLRQVEQRFTDVSTSFKRLQAEKQAADLVLRELTPLETLQDSTALREYLQSLTSKTEIFQVEIKRLNGKLEVQEDRIEELRDTHRLESSSQSAQIEKLQTQVAEAEALLTAAQGADAQAEEFSAGQKAEIERLQKEVESVKRLAREEEEKRVKAISLLKTVRQKLVKAEKERDDVMKEKVSFQEKDRGEREREQTERARLQNALEAANAERERALIGLKAQFDKEVVYLRERFDKELNATKGQYELEGASLKNAHTQEIFSRDSRILSLQQSLSSVTKDKNTFFEDLQMRQAEVESAQSHLESLQSQKTELQYQLREIGDRYALLQDDLAEAQRENETRARKPATSADEVARLLSTAEAKYENRISDLKRSLTSLEKERNDNEADWSRKLREKTREVDDLKQVVGSATRVEEEHEAVVAGLKASIGRIEGESRLLQEQLQELRENNLRVREGEKSWKSQEQDLNSKIATLEQQVDESKQREAQLRAGNKASLYGSAVCIKVQSSAALLERQRNPGVGYWTSRPAESNTTGSPTSVDTPSSETGSRLSSPAPPAKAAKEEEVNLEYLRNVILQFLENKEMREYLKHAIQDGSLSISAFVSTLLQAARSPELHEPATLDNVCRVALDAHYSSGLAPIGSVVPYDESPLAVLATVQDALALLRTAHSLPMSHFHQLTTSASELMILLLTCVSDFTQISTAQAMLYYADVCDLVQNFRLTQDVRQVLDGYTFQLGLVMGDDAKAAREAQVGRVVAYNILYPVISLGLYLPLPEWPKGADMEGVDLKDWQLPHLLTPFEAVVNADGISNADWRRALQAALLASVRRSELIAQCDHVISRVKGVNAIQEDEITRSFLRDLLQSMIQLDLISSSFAEGIDTLMANADLLRLQAEAQDHNVELEVHSAYLESKITPDHDVNDLGPWIYRISQDVTSHSIFALVIIKRFTSLSAAFDVDALSHLCKVLYTYDAALDIMALHVKISDLISCALLFLDQYDCETVGDPQTAVSHLGDVVLFVQYTTSRYHLEPNLLSGEKRRLSSAFLGSTDVIYSADSLSGEDTAAFGPWFKALFDTGSEGIEDSILRSTQPQTLLKISPTLFLQAIMVHLAQKIDRDTLNNGVSYFTGPLLNWTLVGIIKALIKDIQQKGFGIPAQVEILQNLLLSPSCPRPVLALCAPKVFLLLRHKKAKPAMAGLKIDVAAVRRVVTEALGLPAEENLTGVSPIGSRVVWEEEPRQAIQAALLLARSGKAPSLDVERYIKIMPPIKFLHVLWEELLIPASMGELESCKRLATFVLTTPRSPSTPPLLPIFLHVVTPSLIFAIEHQKPPENTMNVELLVTIVSSALTSAFHLELGIRSVTGQPRFALGQPSSGMARKFAVDLRARLDPTSRTILQRLASSQSFATNFPVFMSELG
ncbi:hypothetical protein DXG03_007087 [Asterophora parasitica]|uniref:Mediator of RNA polymerase II transcription subunit 5 n=1 Tax=Asterophora parasitica TaxID=117018 RepID=A0A9P7GJ83_9AGAR|nr:hypothetical protein DXG03_007087 [Asterophora parasitica]